MPGLTDKATSPVGGIPIAGTVEVIQDTHDDLNANANIQVGDADASLTNPVPTVSPIEVMQTPTITAGAYTAGNALGGLLTFANAVRAAGGQARITKVVITDDAMQSAPIDLVLFNQTFTATGDNSAFDPSDADLANCIGYIDVAATDYAEFNDNGVAAKTSGLRMPFPITLVGTSLFGQMVIRNGDTFAATDDITIKLTLERL